MGRRWIGLVVGGILLATGIVLAVTASSSPVIGWFAYAPLSDAVFLPEGSFLVTPRLATAGAIGLVGLVVVSFWAGWMLARRSRRARPAPDGAEDRRDP